MNLLEVNQICKTYGSGEAAVYALKNVSFSVPKGEYVAVVGESGSGKSTLLNMLGGLDTPTSGKVLIDGKDTFAMNDHALTISAGEISVLSFRHLIWFQSLRWSRTLFSRCFWITGSRTRSIWRNC